MTAQKVDQNGYITIEGNPISKVGVFPYSGAQVGHPDPSRHGEIFMVYRPQEELESEETIESFKLLPWINEHEMLGIEDESAPADGTAQQIKTSPEQKGIEGMIGEKVFFDFPYLRGNLRILSSSLKGNIKRGKVELSPGYRARYEFTPGEFEGQKYDAIQRDLRGNHLALVDDGRSGADVSVLDRMVFTVDSNLLTGEPEMELEKLMERLDALEAAVAAMAAAKADDEETPPDVPASDMKEEEAEDMESKDMKSEDEKDKEDAKDMESEDECDEKDMDMKDAMDTISAMKVEIDNLKKSHDAMDSDILGSIADRDELAGNLTNFVGTFDHAKMTVTDVAKYGVDKLGIPVTDGNELTALKAWMHGRKAEEPIMTADGSLGTSGKNIIDEWGKK